MAYRFRSPYDRLYVDLPEGPVDMNREPTNGHEYIHQARIEAKEIFGDPDEELYPSLTEQLEAFLSRNGMPVTLDEMKNMRTYDFMLFAYRLKDDLENIREKFPNTSDFPPIDDEEKVCLFCLGSQLYKQIFPNNDVEDVDDHDPLMNVVIHLNQEEVYTVLKYLKIWNNQIPKNHVIVNWIFAMLTCLHKPLSDECREFLEEFHDELIEQNRNVQSWNKLHFLTAIIKKYFCADLPFFDD